MLQIWLNLFSAKRPQLGTEYRYQLIGYLVMEHLKLVSP